MSSTVDASILSADLLESMGPTYGQTADDLVLSADTTKKQRERDERKRQRDAEPAEEVKEVVKKLSKKQEKRVAQIQKRKDRESKRDSYLETINKHEISTADRQLLTSSKQLNQTLTVKQTLSLLLKKERAGLPLTAEEHNLLYPQKTMAMPNFDDVLMSQEQFDALKAAAAERELKRAQRKLKGKKGGFDSDDSDDDELPPPTKFAPIAPAKQAANNSVAAASSVAAAAVADATTSTNTTMFSFDDLFASTKPSVASKDSGNVTADKKKKRKKKKASADGDQQEDVEVEEESTPMEVVEPMQVQQAEEIVEDEAPKTKKLKKSKAGAEGSSSSMGKNLLSQLMLLKGKSKPVLEAKVEEEEEEDIVNEEADKAVYKVEETVMPVSDLGMILPSVNSSGEAAAPILRTTKVVTVKRPQKIVSDRMNLPVCRMEQEIVEAVQQNDVIILCGETGSGKSTQVPQFLYEAGYAEDGIVGITQPRRVAVTSTADRVNYEMGEMDADGVDTSGGKKKRKKNHEQEGRLVGYQIRYDASTVGSRTKIKFMTDGILLREVTSDILLRNYRVIILDEAHERNVNTDILLGMISRTIPLRKKIAAQEMKKWKRLTPEQQATFAPPLQPLKLIIMSATIRVEDFQNATLFNTIPPLIHVEARQYPVVSHFAKRTELQHYLKETHKKVCQIHRKLPGGGILVFLTGKREILYMCHKLQRSLGGRKASTGKDGLTGEEEGVAGEAEFEGEEEVIDEGEEYRKYSSLGDHDQAEIESDGDYDADEANSVIDSDAEEDEDDDLVATNDDYAAPVATASTVEGSTEHPAEEETGDADLVRQRMLAQILGQVPAVEEEKKKPTAEKQEDGSKMETDPVQAAAVNPFAGFGTEGEELPALKPLIRPLYAMMPAHLQAKIFAPVPPGYRLIVVATNVAETSITIPNISYVVDSGRCKEKVMSSGSTSGGGIARYEIKWISKASADQRQGRAGRTGPGHCYRLYSSNFYHEHMLKFLPPEITLTPLEDVVLQMKALGIAEIESFPFPTMPPSSSLKHAVTLLTNLGAIVPKAVDKSAMAAYQAMLDKVLNSKEPSTDSETAGKLSEMGKLMAQFPLHPRFAKMMIIAARFTSLPKEQLKKFLGYVLTLVATIAERSVFMHDEALGSSPDVEEKEIQNKDEDEEEDGSDEEGGGGGKKKKGTTKLFHHPNGDVMARLRATGAYVYTVHRVCAQQRKQMRHIRRKERPEGVEMNEDEDSDDNEEEEDTTPFSRKELQDAVTDPSIVALCEQNYLHVPSLQRVVDLRSQLQTICESLFPTLHISVAGDSHNNDTSLEAPLDPPNQAEEAALRQVLLSGYCDSIARKAPIGMIKEGSRRKKLTAYFSCNPAITEPLYIHPQSNLFHSDPSATLPEYIVYGSLLKNIRGDTLYMTNLSVVSPNWISSIARDCPLLQWSAPLQSPAPTYDLGTDCVMCHVVPKYGNQQWVLPAVKRPLEEMVPVAKKADASPSSGLVPLGHRAEDEVYRWFARFLLEGSVGIRSKGVLTKDKCKEPTAVITQNKVHPQISALLRALVNQEVRTRAALMAKIRQDPTYLYEELQALLHVEYRKEFRQVWSKLKNA